MKSENRAEPEAKVFELFAGESILHINSHEYEGGMTKRFVVASQVVFADLVYLKKENNWHWALYVTNVNAPIASRSFDTESEAIKFIAPIFSIANGSIGNA